MKLSYSRFSTYLACPYKHYLGYVEGLKSRQVVRPLSFGTDFHKLLENRFKGKKEIQKIFKEITETYYDLPPNSQSDLGPDYLEDLKSIFLDYQKVWKGHQEPTKLEERFEIPIASFKGEKIIFNGVIDELYLHEDKRIIIGEHKTFNRKPDMNTLVMNTQKCLYAVAAQKMYGALPYGVMWDYIKSSPAKEPIWLEKSQKFSSAKSQEITEYSWNRACKARGLDLECPPDYKGNLSNFFFRVPQEFYGQEVENVFEGFVYTSKEIFLRGHKNKTKNVTMNCAFCNFRPICHAEFTGDEELQQHVIRKDFEYRVREEN